MSLFQVKITMEVTSEKLLLHSYFAFIILYHSHHAYIQKIYSCLSLFPPNILQLWLTSSDHFIKAATAFSSSTSSLMMKTDYQSFGALESGRKIVEPSLRPFKWRWLHTLGEARDMVHRDKGSPPWLVSSSHRGWPLSHSSIVEWSQEPFYLCGLCIKSQRTSLTLTVCSQLTTIPQVTQIYRISSSFFLPINLIHENQTNRFPCMSVTFYCVCVSRVDLDNQLYQG